jgi:hypothetical protein
MSEKKSTAEPIYGVEPEAAVLPSEALTTPALLSPRERREKDEKRR